MAYVTKEAEKLGMAEFEAANRIFRAMKAGRFQAEAKAIKNAKKA